jgi:excisionase family DNA binding protein
MTTTTTQREVFGMLMMRVTQAAALFGVHPNTLRYSIRKGRTRAVKVARTWYIPVADVEKQRAQFNETMEGK